MSRPLSRAEAERVTTARVTAEQSKLTSLLDLPAPEGFEIRWVRQSMMGDYDETNLQRALLEGYQPVSRSELNGLDPVYAMLQRLRPRSLTAPDDDWLRLGGLVAMKIPKELAQARRRLVDENVDSQNSAANAVQGLKDPQIVGAGPGLPGVFENRGDRAETGAAAARSMALPIGPRIATTGGE